MPSLNRAVLLHFASLGLIAGLWLTGCKKEDTEIKPAAKPPSPKVAASQLQQAFGSAPPEVRTAATAVSQALQTADYEKAVQSLQTIRARPTLTLDQGTAIHNSELALEARLIAGVAAGDANAKRAYEALKKSRRN